jgi:hypothetical protein
MLMGGAVAAPPGRARQKGKAESGEIVAIEPRRSGQDFAGRRGNWKGAAWLATERTPTRGKIAAARRFGKRTRRELIGRPGRAKRAKGSVARGAMEWRTEGSQSSTTLDCDPEDEDSARWREKHGSAPASDRAPRSCESARLRDQPRRECRCAGARSSAGSQTSLGATPSSRRARIGCAASATTMAASAAKEFSSFSQAAMKAFGIASSSLRGMISGL